MAAAVKHTVDEQGLVVQDLQPRMVAQEAAHMDLEGGIVGLPQRVLRPRQPMPVVATEEEQMTRVQRYTPTTCRESSVKEAEDSATATAIGVKGGAPASGLTQPAQVAQIKAVVPELPCPRHCRLRLSPR